MDRLPKASLEGADALRQLGPGCLHSDASGTLTFLSGLQRTAAIEGCVLEPTFKAAGLRKAASGDLSALAKMSDRPILECWYDLTKRTIRSSFLTSRLEDGWNTPDPAQVALHKRSIHNGEIARND